MLLEQKGVDFEDIAVDGDPGLRQEMTRLSGRRTVPQIWIGERHVGGYDDLAALARSGELDTLLQAV
jgi:glutaredoxin 3